MCCGMSTTWNPRRRVAASAHAHRLWPGFNCFSSQYSDAMTALPAIRLATAKLAGSDYDGREKSQNAHIWIGAVDPRSDLESLEKAADTPETSEIPARPRRTRLS